MSHNTSKNNAWQKRVDDEGANTADSDLRPVRSPFGFDRRKSTSIGRCEYSLSLFFVVFFEMGFANQPKTYNITKHSFVSL